MRTVEEFEQIARQRLDPVHYDYFAGGARDEVTVRANEAALRGLRLLPRVFTGAGKGDLAIDLLGRPVSMPVLIAPTAFHRLAHPDGEAATARAAARAGVALVVSMAATTAIEDVAAAARAEAPDPTLWFQLYLQPDLEFTTALVRRAEAAGVSALVVTVDSPVPVRHRRDDRNGFHQLPDGLEVANMREPGSTHRRDIVMSADLSWSDLDWLRASTDLPVLVKGVLHAEDARLAVRHGAAGVVVSNHGGRQLDGAPATIEVLPEVVEAVAGAVPVLVDGGFRDGADVVKALALGATAVGIGRPVLWGLAAAGQDGVTEVLDGLRADLAHTLALCGRARPGDLTPDQVRR